MFRRIFLIARKETWHILRDFRTVYMALGIPLVLLLLFGYALTMDVEDIPLIVVDGDKTTASRDLVSSFERSRIFTVVARPDDARAILGAFRRFEAKAALIIAPNFSRDLARGGVGKAQLIADGTDANIAAIALGYAAAIAQMRSLELATSTLERQGFTAGRTIRPPIQVKSRNWFNPALKSRWFMVPGLIALLMAMMAALLMSLTIAREWERGTMEQLLVTPVRPLEIVIGKLIPYVFIGIGQLCLVSSTGVLLFGVPILGDLGVLFALSLLFLVGALGQGLFVSIATRQQQLAIQLSFITSMLPALLLSGFMSPIASMPEIVQYLTYIVPARYFLVILRGLFLKGSTLATLTPHVTALSIYAILMFAACVGKFKTRLD
jgi:ABC-2 type transport system permease protein